MTEHTWDETTQRWSDDDPKTDDEKHAFCIRRRGYYATFLTPSMYKMAEETGQDMRWYVINKPIPIASLFTYHGAVTGRFRKRVSARQCGGKEIACLPGKDGACVACADEE